MRPKHEAEIDILTYFTYTKPVFSRFDLSDGVQFSLTGFAPTTISDESSQIGRFEVIRRIHGTGDHISPTTA